MLITQGLGDGNLITQGLLTVEQNDGGVVVEATQSYLSPSILFQIDLSENLDSYSPVSRNQLMYQNSQRTLYVENIGVYKNGDTFTLHGNQAFHIKRIYADQLKLLSIIAIIH